MNATRLTQAVAIAAVFAASAGAFAQEGAMPAGDAPWGGMQATGPSTLTRAERKAETLAANKNGGLGSPGAALYKAYNVTPREATRYSTKTRAERKTETLDAIQHHQLMRAGEAG
jgi:hypothetical protein